MAAVDGNAPRDANQVPTLLAVDATTGLVAPVQVDANGRLLISSSGGVDTFSSVTINGVATTTGVPGSILTITPGNNTGITAGSNAPIEIINTSTQTFATGAVATYDYIQYNPPTLAFVGASVVTNASTLTIEGAPIAGTNATITNTWGLTVNTGSKFYNISTTAITPPGACTAALITTTGNVDAGTHSYEVTFVTAVGTETKLGTASNTVTNDGSNQQNALTAIPTGAVIGSGLITARKIYRTKAGGSVYFLLTTISDNTTTTYTDNTADASLGAQALLGGDTTGGIVVQGTLATQAGITLASASTPATTGSAVTFINNSNGNNMVFNVGTNSMGFIFLQLGSQFLGLGSHGEATFTPTVATSGNHTAFTITPSANTGLSTTVEHSQFILSASTQTNATGTVALWRYVQFGQPTYAFAGSSTVTTATNVDIASPFKGANSSFTNTFALTVGSASTIQTSGNVASLAYAAISVPAHTINISSTSTTEITSNDMSSLRLDQVTYTAGASITVDSAATLTIVGAPIAAGSTTLTNAYAINVKAGLSRFTGGIDLSGIATTSPEMTIAATTSTPSTTFSAVNATNAAPSGFMQIVVAGQARYIPFYA